LFEHDLFGKPVPAFPDHAGASLYTEQRKKAGKILTRFLARTGTHFARKRYIADMPVKAGEIEVDVQM
jgi:hypothetical protein